MKKYINIFYISKHKIAGFCIEVNKLPEIKVNSRILEFDLCNEKKSLNS